MLGSNDREIKSYLRSGPPGSGKTSGIMKKLENNTNQRIMYLSYSHDLLKEQYYRLKNKKVSVRHWKGLKIMCPCLKRDEYGFPIVPLIGKLVELKIPNGQICSVCEKGKLNPEKDCRYQKQFDRIKSVPNVLAPIEYAFTKRLEDYEPDIIIVDDCLTKIRIHPKRKKLEYLLFLLSVSAYFIDRPIASLEELSKLNLESIMPKLTTAYKTNLKEHIKDIKENLNSVKYDPLYTTSPEEIEIYLKKAKAHGFRDQFATPALLSLFDYVWKEKCKGKKVDLYIIEAILNMGFLDILAKCYQEEGVTVNFKSDGFKPKIVNPGSVVHVVGNKNIWYPDVSVKTRRTQKKIKEMIEWILFYYFDNDPNLKIGVIMKKPKGRTKVERQRSLYRKLSYFIPKQFKNPMVETFGNLRGKNSLEHCDVLFIIGTYSIDKKDMIRTFSFWSGHDPETDEFINSEPHGGYYRYKDTEMEACRWQFEEYEMYQAVHRIRPLLAKKSIFLFGLVPKEIEQDGLEVVRLSGSWILKSRWLLKYMKENSNDFRKPRAFVEDEMVKQFNISRKWAYREILKIVNDTKHLRFERRDMIQWIVYEP